jgi:hypothetical protein
VGEDGELIQPDMSADLDAYSEFVETYVHRDPLWFRVRGNIREHRLIYLFLITVNLCMATTLINDLFSNLERVGNDVLGIILLNLGIGVLARLVYMILQMDTRK